MRSKLVPALVAVLAVIGLAVSVTARSPLETGPVDRAVEPGAAPVLVDHPARAPTAATREARQGRPQAAAAVIGRSDATALRRATRRPTSAPPLRARLDPIGIDAPVRPVGVRPDGQMRLPADPSVLGWYRYGSAPGDPAGTTVLAGHLDSRRFGLGPLVRLRDMEVGDTFSVASRDGTDRRYSVSRVTRYDRQSLPADLFSRTGPERLHLITCGGAYDAGSGGYQLNLVVTAVPAS